MMFFPLFSSFFFKSDTDFIFLARDELERAGRVLREDGWVVL